MGLPLAEQLSFCLRQARCALLKDKISLAQSTAPSKVGSYVKAQKPCQELTKLFSVKEKNKRSNKIANSRLKKNSTC
jgi:hypothetical protein